VTHARLPLIQKPPVRMKRVSENTSLILWMTYRMKIAPKLAEPLILT